MQERERVKVAVKDNKMVVRDPKSRQRLTTEGKWVVKDVFWMRRIACGDVVVLEEQSQQEGEA